MHSDSTKDYLRRLVENEGFSEMRILYPDDHKGDLAGAIGRSSHADGDLKERLLKSPSVMMVGLAFSPQGVPIEPDDLIGTIAPFSQSFHYREATTRLKRVVRRLCSRCSYEKSDFRIFCNSRFPEKPMAALCGLGFLGRNGLLISRRFGSRMILAGVLLPFPCEPDKAISPLPPAYEMCGSCNRCITSCPVDAIDPETQGPSPVDRHRCLSDLSGRLRETDEVESQALGFRLYGCTDCQDVCPYNTDLSKQPMVERGHIGTHVPIRSVLTAAARGGESLEDFFTGTVLGQNYLNPWVFVRNALIIIGNGVMLHSDQPLEKEMVQLVQGFTDHHEPAVRQAAQRAMSIINT